MPLHVPLEAAQQRDGGVTPARNGVPVDLEGLGLPDVEPVVDVHEVVRA